MGINTERNSDELDDSVRIKLGKNDDVKTIEQYDFHSSILQQPSKFAVHISGAHGASEIIQSYPPGPEGKCALYIGKYRQFTGEIDDVRASGDANATTVELIGRDLMARIHDQDIVGERSFNNVTYEKLVQAALSDTQLDGKTLFASNTANRKVRSGVGVKVYTESTKPKEIKNVIGGDQNKFKTVVTCKLGETWGQFLERHFSKLGLFLWCDANGDFVLSRPNSDQAPMFQFFRKKGQGKSLSNVKSFSWSNDTTHRFSHMIIFARNYGRKYGHNHTNGRFDDVEMMGLGINRRRVFRDAHVTSVEEAEYFARKQIAEGNRAGWKLTYVISGHTAPTKKDINTRAVIIPDTVAMVDDDELGIHMPMYIESVQYRSPPRQTIVTMMRPQDIVFGEFQGAVAKAKKAVAKQMQVVKERKAISYVRDKPNVYTNVHKAAVSTITRPERK